MIKMREKIINGKKHEYAPEIGGYRMVDNSVEEAREESEKEMKVRKKKGKTYIDKKDVIQFRSDSKDLEEGINKVMRILDKHDILQKLAILRRVDLAVNDHYREVMKVH